MFYGTDNQFPYYRPILGLSPELSMEIHLHRRHIIAITYRDAFVKSIVDAFGSTDRVTEVADAYSEKCKRVRESLDSVEIQHYLQGILEQPCTTVWL